MKRSSQGSRPASESRASSLPVHLGSQPQTQFHGLPFPSQLSFPSPGVITFVFTTLKKTNILKRGLADRCSYAKWPLWMS